MIKNQITIKKHRHLAIDTDEIIALDFNESLNDLKIFLRGGGNLSIEGKKAVKIWNHLSKDLNELIYDEPNDTFIEDFG